MTTEEDIFESECEEESGDWFDGRPSLPSSKNKNTIGGINMWSTKNAKEDFKSEAGATKMERSGCYQATVDKAVLKIGQNGVSRGIEFHVETKDGNGKFQVWFIKKDGEEITHSVAMLNRMMKIAGVKVLPSNFTLKQETDNFGNNLKLINELAGIKFGAFLQHEYGEYNGKQFVKFECKGFYYPDTDLTSSETEAGQKEPKRFVYWKNKFSERNVEVTGKAPTKSQGSLPVGTSELEDEFPF